VPFLTDVKERIDLSRFDGTTLLLTGASGMLGSHLCKLLALGQSAHEIDLTLCVRDIADPNLEKFKGRSRVHIESVFDQGWLKRYDWVIHAASPASPTKYGNHQEIVQANRGILERLTEHSSPSKVVFISSGEVYISKPEGALSEDSPTKSSHTGERSRYPMAKLEAEEFLLNSESQTDASIVRLFHTFGPGMKRDDGRSFADFIWSAARGDSVYLRSDEEYVRTFCDLEDSAVAILKVLIDGGSGEIYNVGSNQPVTVPSFAKLVAEIAGVDLEVDPTPMSRQLSYLPSPNKVMIPSTEKLMNLGWEQKIPLEQTVRRTLAWARSQLDH
jgi:dTDP-glucose 4,6-dehydratase